ncbi:MAG: hypothetical protein WBF77_03665 [Sulfurimonadaceae bacterium]
MSKYLLPLFMVGLKDEIIEQKHSADLFVKAKEPKAIWIVEDAGHVECIHNIALNEEFLFSIDEAVKGQSNFATGVRYYEDNSSTP